MNMHCHVNKITPRFGFGWTRYRDGGLYIVAFDFYKRSLAVHVEVD